MIYLDNSATTRQFDEVTDLIYKISKEKFGNPSSLHSMGFDAEAIIFEARERLRDELPDGNIVFTSGGTESNNMSIFSAAGKFGKHGKKIIASKIEHPAILEPLKRLEKNGFIVEYLDVDENGLVDQTQLKEKLDTNTFMVTVMSVNNEVGTIEPVLPIYKIIQEFNNKKGTEILFHTDAVQAFGKIHFDNAPFDLISISGHKIHGPKGIGALFIKEGVKLNPFILGGGQEKGMRSGTENVGAIAGIGLATLKSYENLFQTSERMKEINDYLMKGLMLEIPDVKLNGSKDPGMELFDYGSRCPSILNVSFAGIRGEVLLHSLEQDKIFVSTGSACSSNKNGGSHVLKAMKLNESRINGAIRFSFSEDNTKEEMDFVIDKTKKSVEKLRRIGSLR